MTKRTVRTLLAAGTIAVAAVGLSACHRHEERLNPERLSKRVEGRVNRALDELHATDAQRQQVQTLAKQVLADALTLRQGETRARREIAEELLSDQPDAAKIHALVDQQVDALRAFAQRTVDLALQNHSVLTPEQRAQLRAELSRRLDRR